MWRDSESEADFLNFTEVAEQIATLATTPELLPISIGVFGSWGTGKSTILRLVENRLPKEEDGAPVIVRFDAWLYQGFDDSRAALMEAVSRELLDLAQKKKTLVQKAKDFGARINYFRGLGLIADFGVGMALGIPPGLLTTAGGALSSIFAGSGTAEDQKVLREDAAMLKQAWSELIRPAEKKTPPEQIDDFRREFGELLDGLNTTLVLFIDNLDRCLPDVAIGTLEAIRLFLFMPRTAFVIAADEDMIRHSVARHFQDPNVAHVRDYLDKVIQVPLRVPQVGAEDLRAYMYSLFVSLAAPTKLEEVQTHLMSALHGGWRGDTFDKGDVTRRAGDPPGLLDNLAIADQLAPILAWAPNINGNPRIVKRLLNAISLRQILARNRKMNVDLATLAKLAVFERCTDGPATLQLYQLIMEGRDVEKYLLPPDKIKGKAPELPSEWGRHSDFIERWRVMEPLFDDASNLRAAVFLSRDVMAPARSRTALSDAAKQAVDALLKVSSVNSPVGRRIVEGLNAAERRIVISHLIEAMRGADWSEAVAGIHGALLIANVSPEAAAELKAFISTLQVGEMERGIAFLLKRSGMITEP